MDMDPWMDWMLINTYLLYLRYVQYSTGLVIQAGAGLREGGRRHLTSTSSNIGSDSETGLA